MSRRRLRGVVVRRSGEMTVRVEVTRLALEPFYKKRIRRSKFYLAHDADNAAAVGDRVEIEECAPISKRKSFRVLGVLGK